MCSARGAWWPLLCLRSGSLGGEFTELLGNRTSRSVSTRTVVFSREGNISGYCFELFGVVTLTLSAARISELTECVYIIISRSYPVPSLVALGNAPFTLTTSTRLYHTACVIEQGLELDVLIVYLELQLVLCPALQWTRHSLVPIILVVNGECSSSFSKCLSEADYVSLIRSVIDYYPILQQQ